MKCLNCDKPATGKGKYCSETCRAVYNRNKRSAKPEQTVTGTATGTRTVTDACGNVHQVDFQGRRDDYELLESWVNGNGSESQQRLGALARGYREVDVQGYLGYC
ncbi:hypothetical protein LCGC14_2173060 [marine sediment metagenome]|uniref:Uncharacterized protein n=1 Tax=marine sediment metagenome TaxID=412755 RepID=A0A0F9EBM3_9ZZZZ